MFLHPRTCSQHCVDSGRGGAIKVEGKSDVGDGEQMKGKEGMVGDQSIVWTSEVLSNL